MLMTYAKLLPPQQTLLTKAITNLKLSPRGVYKVLRVARTTAGLANATDIQKDHLLEALSYRQLDVPRRQSQQI